MTGQPVYMLACVHNGRLWTAPLNGPVSVTTATWQDAGPAPAALAGLGSSQCTCHPIHVAYLDHPVGFATSADCPRHGYLVTPVSNPRYAPGAGCGRPGCLVHCTHTPAGCRCSFTITADHLGYCMTEADPGCEVHGGIHG